MYVGVAGYAGEGVIGGSMPDGAGGGGVSAAARARPLGMMAPVVS